MTTTTLLQLMGLLYGVSEVALALTRRSRAGAARQADRGSLRVLWAAILVSLAAGVLVASRRWAPLPGPADAWAGAGLVVLLGGLALRWTAILTLRRAFTVDVAIAEGQPLIDRGVYRLVRHPAYTGNLLAFAGFLIGFDDALGWLVAMAPITAAFVHRIGVEEQAMRSGFGERYGRYAERTRKLIPFVY